MSLDHNSIKQEISPENKNTKSTNAYLCQMYLFFLSIFLKFKPKSDKWTRHVGQIHKV